VRVEERQLLCSMRGIVGGIKIDGDAPSMSVKTLAVTFDHATGQFHAHAIKSLRTNRVLETRQRGLREFARLNWPTSLI
jgi:hypothetical protein